MGQTVRDELVEFRASMKVPAAIAAVTDADELLEIAVVGARSMMEPADHATVDDLWHIGSCGKSITAMVYARLVEAGKAEWGAPVRDLFDDLDGVDRGWGSRTVDDLFHCIAGAPANPPRSEMIRLHKTAEPIADQRTNAVAGILAKPPKNRGRFVYSNLSYVAIGAAIDRLAGMPYEEALHRHVFEPLGMNTVGIGPPPLVLGHQPRLVLGPLTLGRGKPAAARSGDGTLADNPPLFTPAGRLHMSVGDWAKFQRVVLNSGEPLVSSQTLSHLLAYPPKPGGGGMQPMSMGWGNAERLGFTYAQQGSNTMWAATAVVDMDSGLTAMVVTNDGRMKVLRDSANLAADLLRSFH